MEQKYRIVRKHLDELGYPQILVVDALPLVEKLLSDLIHTTENLKEFQVLAENAVKERDSLRIGIEPYKCDNAKLVQECNDLHLAFLQFKEQSDKIQKQSNIHLHLLEEEHSNCENKLDNYKQQIRSLQLESAKKSDKILQMETNKRYQGSKTQTRASASSTGKKSNSNVAVANTKTLTDDKINHLNNEVKKLKDERLEQAELLDSYAYQIKNRDAEIQRLTSLLEGGRPIQAIHKDCCLGKKDIDIQVAHLMDEVSLLQRENKSLNSELKESIIKQHEAMKRALHLADRNRQLEKELRDIDQMALAVEAECNNNLRNNRDKVEKLQSCMEESNMLIQRLEKEIANVTREKQVLITDLEAVNLEKRHLENMLESAMTEKKKMTNKINQCTVIENDLNIEIDRLMQQTAMQKRKIVELECFIKSDKFEVPLNSHSKTYSSKELHETNPNSKRDNSKSPTRKSGGKSGEKAKKSQSALGKKKHASPTRTASSPFASRNAISSSRVFSNDVIQVCMEKLQENFDRERDHLQCDLNDLKRQVEFCRENHTNLNKNPVCNYPGPESVRLTSRTENDANKQYQYSSDRYIEVSNQNEVLNDLKRKLSDNNARIEGYQMEIRDLTREKHDLLNKLESARNRGESNADNLSANSTLKRLERERDLVKCEMQHLVEERDRLRDRLKGVTDVQMSEQSKMQDEMRKLEDKIHSLELERRQLIHKEGSKSADLGNLEEEVRSTHELLRKSQTDLTQQRAYSSQLKILQEQTDRALADAQIKLRNVEEDFRNSKRQIENLEREISTKDQEIQKLKTDISTIRGSLHQIDSEKDGLLMTVDDKTERLDLLERELKMKQSKIRQLEDNLADVQQKLSTAMDEHNTREHMIRTTSSESDTLRKDLSATMKTNENIKLENRRLQEELALCTRNYKILSNDYEISKRQIEDLKRQLQQYVAEVKRAEDLISQKEIERSEMLDHFRSLSQEATVLESNNNDLETEAAKSKVQLSVTLDHVAELEDKMHSQEAIIKSYESQISELTSKVANLEMKVRQESDEKKRIEEDMMGLRELCMKLDQQKDGLLQKLNEKEDGRSRASRDTDRLRKEYESLRNITEKDKHTVASLENLLAQSREETVDQRLLNEELLETITKYKTDIATLELKMRETTQQLDLYQEKALDYCQQMKLLKREIANEKYGKYKADSDYSKRYSNVDSSKQNVQNEDPKLKTAASLTSEAFVDAITSAIISTSIITAPSTLRQMEKRLSAIAERISN